MATDNADDLVPFEDVRVIDKTIQREIWGLVGYHGKEKAVFPTCSASYGAGWRPSGFVGMN